MFTTTTHHKARHILKENKRYFLLIAIQNEPRSFVGTVIIKNTTHLHFALFTFHDLTLVGYDTYCPSVYTTVSANNCFSIIFFELFKGIGINKAVDHLRHIVRLAISRKNSIE